MVRLLRPTLCTLLLSASMAPAGCDAGSEMPEGADESEDARFLVGGKADGGSVGNDVAAGVIRLANEASFEVLDASDDVGLDRRAAEGIVLRRSGPDGIDGTDDDTPFETLEQLDAVPWVGPSAFEKMVVYAQDNGFVTAAAAETSPAGVCEGSFTPAQIGAVARDGWVEFSLTQYERDCDEDEGQTECSPWTEVELQSPHRLFRPRLDGHVLDIDASDGVIRVDAGAPTQWFEGTLEVHEEQTVLTMDLGYSIYECHSSGHCYTRHLSWTTLSGPVTADCISVSNSERLNEMTFAPGVVSYTERALVAVSN